MQSYCIFLYKIKVVTIVLHQALGMFRVMLLSTVIVDDCGVSVSVEFDLSDITNVKCSVCSSRKSVPVCPDDYVSRIFQR